MKNTFLKFGGFDNVIKEYQHWYIMLRPKQVTLGSLVILSKENKFKFSHLSSSSFSEYEIIIKEIENVLSECFCFDKINYCMLMMDDPDVHFHVFPRYSNEKNFSETLFKDVGWPGLPHVSSSNTISTKTMNRLLFYLKSKFYSS